MNPEIELYEEEFNFSINYNLIGLLEYQNKIQLEDLQDLVNEKVEYLKFKINQFIEDELELLITD